MGLTLHMVGGIVHCRVGGDFSHRPGRVIGQLTREDTDTEFALRRKGNIQYINGCTT